MTLLAMSFSTTENGPGCGYNYNVAGRMSSFAVNGGDPCRA